MATAIRRWSMFLSLFPLLLDFIASLLPLPGHCWLIILTMPLATVTSIQLLLKSWDPCSLCTLGVHVTPMPSAGQAAVSVSTEACEDRAIQDARDLDEVRRPWPDPPPSWDWHQRRGFQVRKTHTLIMAWSHCHSSIYFQRSKSVQTRVLCFIFL